MIRLISFSGGRSSAMMAKMMRDKGMIRESDVVCFANTGKEHQGTLDFVHECDTRWKIGLVWLEYDPDSETKFRRTDYHAAARNGEPFNKLIEKKSYLPNAVTRFCTSELKVKPIKRYMQSLGHEHWHVAMGIRYDEPLRWGKILQNTQKEPFFYELPLYDWGITKADVSDFWKNQPFDLEIPPEQGNCDLCFLKGKAKLMRIMRENPKLADWWIDKETRVGNTFKKEAGYRDLRLRAVSQTQIFEPETADYPCHCNAD